MEKCDCAFFGSATAVYSRPVPRVLGRKPSSGSHQWRISKVRGSAHCQVVTFILDFPWFVTISGSTKRAIEVAKKTATTPDVEPFWSLRSITDGDDWVLIIEAFWMMKNTIIQAYHNDFKLRKITRTLFGWMIFSSGIGLVYRKRISQRKVPGKNVNVFRTQQRPKSVELK